jgi:hypothetical protein
VRTISAIAVTALGAAALTACSSGHPAASGTAATTTATKHRTFVFTAQDEQGNMSLEDLGARSAPGGPDLGDLLAFTQILTRGGKPAGAVHVVAVGVDHKRHLSEATATMTLHDGTIQLAGTVSPAARFTLAVTGGTGAYTGDTGVMDFDASGSAQTMTVHLSRRIAGS